MVAPVWAGALSEKNIDIDIERIQKNAFRVITASNHFSYEEAHYALEETSLDERIDKLCMSFTNSKSSDSATFPQ